jgi:hypothetical protein
MYEIYKKNSMAGSSQTNYTNLATDACQWS